MLVQATAVIQIADVPAAYRKDFIAMVSFINNK
jgi:hypothetical protein